MKNSSQSTLDFKQAVWNAGKVIPVLFAVSVAVGAPPTAAIVTAGIGGIALMLGTLMSGAVLATRGPSLALLVVVASAIATLGYQEALAVFFMAGLLQAVLGVTHTGKYILRWLSPEATKGVLSALALVLIAQQLLSWFTGTMIPATSLWELALVVPTLLYSEKSFMVGFFALSLLIIHLVIRHTSPKGHWSHYAPAGLTVILIAGVLSFMVGGQSYMAAPHMGIVLPSFQLIETWNFWYYVALIAVVGLLQTFSMPQLRSSTMKVSKNIAVVGLSNIVTAVFGGLPMTTKAYRPGVDQDLVSYRVVTRLCTAVLVAQMLIWVMIVPLLQSIPIVAAATLLLFLASKYVYTTAKSVWYSKKAITIFVVAVVSVLVTNQPLLALVTATILHKLWEYRDMALAKPMFLYDVAVKQRDQVYEVKLIPTEFRGDRDHLTAELAKVPDHADMHVSIVGSGILNPSLRESLKNTARTRTGKVVLAGGEEEEDYEHGEVFPPVHWN